ncbi:T9SS type A sorting domain-containing protein, partial [candidate division KSB1 bacterium]|nr:T9SS type A sorting domain-containing protein [candidate division KSB1 bacterium]NIR70980.1 T9SS type A sorting domain-containing protein [candidate division KSB1 bacterium]NIS24721.1 T9SS type A sorting domain-containing protein [candidate division KSB1 bacterium]NIT71625.1 T9SS type A sorting domain-containing protein [candidate division KSB1 bacterium]NIU25332.1 T9SS type A sorting domain-containing protein [candidate division KSB1 bacterium]
LRFGKTAQFDRSLSPLPTSVLEGTLRDENGRGVKAELTLFVKSEVTEDFTVHGSSDAFGRFVFDDLLVTFPLVVEYEKLEIEPEIPYVSETLTEITLGEAGTMLPDITLKRADVLVVNDDPDYNFEKFYLSALDSLELTGHIWRTQQRGVAPVSRMGEFNRPTIIWYTGDATSNEAISKAEQDSIAAYLDRGGRLFLTGQNIAQSLSATDFLQNRLHTRLLGALEDKLLHGVENDPVGGGLRNISIFGDGGANNQTAVDVLLAQGEAKKTVIFDTTAVTDAVAGIRVEDPATGSRLVFFGFGFEAITAGAFPRPGFATRKDVMHNVLHWLSGLATPVADSKSPDMIDRFALLPNYPNPFNGETILRYRISSNFVSTQVKLEIYNILGRKVRILVDKRLKPGEYSVQWDGTDDSGQGLASGLYLAKLSSGQERQILKMLYVK